MHEKSLLSFVYFWDFFPLSEVEQKFSGMLNALKFGAPPHGGSAPGIDRIVMLLANEQNIREVIAFPMNQQAMDLMMNAPIEVEKERLEELGIKIDNKKKIKLLFLFFKFFSIID